MKLIRDVIIICSNGISMLIQLHELLVNFRWWSWFSQLLFQFQMELSRKFPYTRLNYMDNDHLQYVGVAGSYSISSVTGATSYTWAYTGTGTASSSTTSVI